MTAAVVGKGVYGLAFAARLAHVNYNTLKRWACGYTYTFQGQEFYSPPRWEVQHGKDAGVLGFLDLVEARMMGKFRQKGVKWSTIALASDETKRLLGIRHPFATQRLKTNGRRIFLEVGEGAGDRALIEIAENQRVFEPFITPFLIDFDFDSEDLAERWWPIGKDREVIVDPSRSFGKPIVHRAGVPTAVLARAAEAEKSIVRVSRWYNVSEKEVQDAVEFERTLVAA